MKCKKHLGDLSSVVGVCASCLRERLFILIAAQAQAQEQEQEQAQARTHLEDCNDQKEHRDPNLRQPPVACQPVLPLPHRQTYPRSVSPCAGQHRKSSSFCDHPVNRPSRHRRRFFSTPQVGPTFSNNPANEPRDFLPEKKPSKFSLLSFLFRKRSDDIRDNMLPNPDPTSQPSSSSSIFGLLKKKQSRALSVADSTVSGSACQRKRSVVVSNRGMSPARGSDDKEDQDGDRSPSNSEYSSEDCPQSWKRTSAPSTAFVTPMRTTTPHHHPRSRSGFVFCLSPLVRMSPRGNWKNKGGIPAEIGYSGNLSETASFCKNRSRKLADFGRGAYLR